VRLQGMACRLRGRAFPRLLGRRDDRGHTGRFDAHPPALAEPPTNRRGAGRAVCSCGRSPTTLRKTARSGIASGAGRRVARCLIRPLNRDRRRRRAISFGPIQRACSTSPAEPRRRAASPRACPRSGPARGRPSWKRVFKRDGGAASGRNAGAPPSRSWTPSSSSAPRLWGSRFLDPEPPGAFAVNDARSARHARASPAEASSSAGRRPTVAWARPGAAGARCRPRGRDGRAPSSTSRLAIEEPDPASSSYFPVTRRRNGALAGDRRRRPTDVPRHAAGPEAARASACRRPRSRLAAANTVDEGRAGDGRRGGGGVLGTSAVRAARRRAPRRRGAAPRRRPVRAARAGRGAGAVDRPLSADVPIAEAVRTRTAAAFLRHTPSGGCLSGPAGGWPPTVREDAKKAFAVPPAC